MQAVQAMVQQAMQYIDQTPDLDTKIELIKTLNNVSAGKASPVLYLFSCIPYLKVPILLYGSITRPTDICRDRES